nr:hypothetical protein [uncultured Draconibacterium sp.]
MKNKFFKSMVSILAIGFFMFLVFGSSSDWEKKQFDSYESLGEAFRNASYSDVKEKFGEPYYKFLDITNQEITYRWKGVGVKGHPDAYLNFEAMEYLTGFVTGYVFETVDTDEGYHVPSNDGKPIHID